MDDTNLTVPEVFTQIEPIKNIFDFKKWTLIKFEIISLCLLLFFLPWDVLKPIIKI